MGDPSGRTEERKPADQAKTEHHRTKLEQNINTFFERANVYAHARLPPSGKTVHKPKVVDNREWLHDLRLLDFLRTAGVHVRLNTMLARERCVSYGYDIMFTAMMSYVACVHVWSHTKA